jgi:hypothetical protein
VRGLLDRKVPAAWIAAGTLLALLLAAAATYAAALHGGRGKERHEPAGKRHEPAGTATTPGVPVATQGSAALRIIGHPPLISTRSTARFRIAAAGGPMLRCRLDQHPARQCEDSAVYRGVGVGSHTFYVQALRRGRVTARSDFGWTVLEPKPFTVASRLADVGPLFPGAAPSVIPVVISNPNGVAITITSLRVGARGGAPGCAPADNLALTAPALAGGKLRIAAHSSVSLPSPTVAAPTIALRELPVPQDACKNADFDLAFSGSAGG